MAKPVNKEQKEDLGKLKKIAAKMQAQEAERQRRINASLPSPLIFYDETGKMHRFSTGQRLQIGCRECQQLSQCNSETATVCWRKNFCR